MTRMQVGALMFILVILANIALCTVEASGPPSPEPVTMSPTVTTNSIVAIGAGEVSPTVEATGTPAVIPESIIFAVILCTLCTTVLLGGGLGGMICIKQVSKPLKKIVRELSKVNTRINAMKHELDSDRRLKASLIQEEVKPRLGKYAIGEDHSTAREGYSFGTKIEIFVAPSIRHCGNPNEPQPLAEDMAGVISLPSGYLVGYVADGAPGPQVEDYISSRIHTRTLGRDVFLEWAAETLKRGKLPDPSDKAHFKEEITQTMERRLREILKQNFWKSLERRWEDLPNFGGRRGLQWQVSFTGIVLNVRTRILHLFQMGDTAACVGTKSGVEVTNGQPIFTKLFLEEEDIDFEFTFDPVIMIFKDVQGVAIMSDGVYGKYDTLTRLSHAKSFKELIDLLPKISIPSADDKALLIVSLLEE